MNLRTVICLCLGLAGNPGPLGAAPALPLEPGEELRFSVSWAIVPGAGEITVSAAADAPGRTRVSTHTATRRLARLLLPFEATADSIYDNATERLLSLHDRSQTRGKYVEHLVTFDHAKRTANYLVVGEPAGRTLPMPPGSPSDLITALMDTRHWDIQPGQTRDVLVLFNDDFYELTIHALRYENLDTPLGSFRTLVLQPRMDKTPPKGMFKRGSTVQVWISQGERRLPVKFEVEFNIGTGTATLVSYTPPRPAQPGTAPAASPAPGN